MLLFAPTVTWTTGMKPSGVQLVVGISELSKLKKAVWVRIAVPFAGMQMGVVSSVSAYKTDWAG